MEEAIPKPVTDTEANDSGAGVDFDALFRSKFAELYGYVASLVGDREAAEEIAAAAFERAIRKRHRYRPSRGTPEAWLFGIARNAALDDLRRRRRRASLPADPPAETQASTESQVVGRWRAAHVRRAMRRLDGRQRELIALKFAGGLSNRQIAEVLSVSETNAGSMLYRAMEKLRRECHEAA